MSLPKADQGGAYYGLHVLLIVVTLQLVPIRSVGKRVKIEAV